MQKISELPRLPVIRRARGYRLYDQRGRRFLDLSVAGGRAILGHRTGRLMTELKNVLEKGLLFPMPSVYLLRLVKELSHRYPDFGRIVIVSSVVEAERLIARYLQDEDVSIVDPALGETGQVIWGRPLLPEKLRRQALRTARAVLPVIPFAMPGLQAICFPESGGQLEPQVAISPMLAAGALRSLYELDRFVPPRWFLDNVMEDIKCWEQRGPYIRPLFSRDLYPEVFDRFLREGVIISPRMATPTVLPGQASAGEFAKLMRLFEEDI